MLNFRNFYKKMFSSYHIKYKHSLVEFVSIISILMVFEAATFEVSWVVYFQTIQKKLLVYVGYFM